MNTSPHLSAAVLRTARTAAEHLQVPWASLLQQAGVNSTTLDDPDARVSQDTVHGIWRVLTTHSTDPALGIRLAEQAATGSLGVIEYVVRNAKTMRSVLGHMVRYSRLVNDGVECTIHETDTVFVFNHHWQTAPTQPSRVYAEWVVGYIALALSRQLDNIPPVWVGFENSAPADTSVLTRILKCEVRFDQPKNQIAFERRWLDTPISGTDSRLLQIMERYADTLLGALPKAGGFIDAVRRAVADEVTEGARLEDVAHTLGVSSRSLQRRLRDTGTTYQALVQTVRADLAAGYLAKSDMSIGEIAFALGYSEPSAFHRSFKRVRGVTPRQFRSQASVA